MAWKPIADRIGTLPLVIAGPILRRVEKDNVSVWLALKESCLLKDQKQLTLKVYNSGIDTGSKQDTLVMQGSRDTIALGEHLHIVVLTARASGTMLQAGITYSYNVTGNGLDFTANYDICYADFALPTFSLPPTDLNKLRIIHASCRKLHADGTDAMADIDRILDEASGIPATMPLTRPHQLFLTGDQIYADDVDPLLLFLIRDLCEGIDAKLDVDAAAPQRLASNRKSLLNWQESLPVGKWPDKVYKLEDIKNATNTAYKYDGALEVARRSYLLEEESGLHFPAEWEVAENHLIKLGEYYSMYLLMWSPLLWPADNEYPALRNVYSYKYFPSESDRPITPTGTLEQIAEISSEGAGDEEVAIAFSRSVIRAQRYQDELKAVRRALANIPTYMICDDHEITDDWFLDLNWCKTVLSAALGRRILQNGLLAYTLFQGWGNDPAQFDAQRSTNLGPRLLTTVERWANGSGYDATDPSSLLAGSQAHDYWESMGIITGVPDLASSVAARQLLPQNTSRVRHHFYLAWEKHEVIVLDTRTARAYPGPSDGSFAALISPDSLRDQLAYFSSSAATTVEVTFLVIATPISGVPNIEKLLTGLARTFGAGEIAYSRLDPLSKLGFHLLPQLIKDAPMVTDSDLNYLTDAEAYGYQQKGLQDLYARIGRGVAARQNYNASASPGRIVVLSGDVHYGFTNRVEFWIDRFADKEPIEVAQGTTHFVLAQLCASALKNEKDSPIGIESQHYPFAINNTGTYGYLSLDEVGYKEEILYPAVWLGWVPPAQGDSHVGDWYKADSQNRQKEDEVKINKLNPVIQANRERDKKYVEINSGTSPDWAYRINYLKRLPTPDPDANPVADPATPQQRADTLKILLAAAENNKNYLLRDSPGSECVGKNNFGEVTFDWGNTEETKFLHHNLWWSETFNGIDAVRQPHSKFAVLLGKDDTNRPRPTAPYLS